MPRSIRLFLCLTIKVFLVEAYLAQRLFAAMVAIRRKITLPASSPYLAIYAAVLVIESPLGVGRRCVYFGQGKALCSGTRCTLYGCSATKYGADGEAESFPGPYS